MIIRQLLAKNLAFAIYRLPHESTVSAVASRLPVKSFSVKNLDIQQGFVIAPFDAYKSRKAFLIKPELTAHNTGEMQQLTARLASFPDKPLPSSPTDQQPAGKKTYLKQAESLIKSLQQGEAQKVVLSRILQKELPAGFDFDLFFNLLQKGYPRAFVYVFHLPGQGLWAGATPETLLDRKENTAEIMALAGTQKRPQKETEITWEQKEKEEQAFVSQFVETQMNRLFPGQFEKGEIQTLFAGPLAHLCTRFRIPAEALAGKTGMLVSLLHPTPAVCGLPKERAWQLIAETEDHHRRFYTGFLGPWFPGKTAKLFVNLRCTEFSGRKMTLYTGGGLTTASVPEKEWQETEDKAQTLLSVVEKMRNFAP